MGDILILFLITVFVFFPLMTYALFWYDTANGPYREKLAGASGGKPRRWIFRGLLSSMLSHVIVVVTWPLGFARGLWKPGTDGSNAAPPVILIHGLYHNASAWIFYRFWLRRAGYERVHLFNYNSMKHSFHEISERLAGWMAEGGRFAAGEPVLMVGHSLGGLLARAYAVHNHGDGSPIVRTVVTLGTPHMGSRMVVFAMGKLARSLAYKSPLMEELGAQVTPPAVDCTAVYSPVDNMVLPNGSLKPPPGWREKMTAPICHISMLYHRPTFELVLESLSI